MIDRRDFLAMAAASTVFPAMPATAAKAGLNGDVAILADILEQLHPGLYRYTTPSALRSDLARLNRQWVKAPSLEQRYLNLAKFLSTIKCGHSYGNFFNQKKQVASQLFERADRLPFAFDWINSEMIVTQDQSGTGTLLPGTIIRSVDGLSTKAIVQQLMPYARADGNNDDKRRALLSVSGADTIETFDVFFGLLRGKASGRYALVFRRPGDTRDRRADFAAITRAQRQSFSKQADYDDDRPVWDWTVRPDGIAILTMDGWALYNSKWDWKAWLVDRLDSLKGAKGLVIDIRQNEGGEDCGDVILARLAAKNLVLPKARRLVRYAKVPDRLNAYLDTWDDSFRDWGKDVTRYDERFYLLSRWDEGGILEAKGPALDIPAVTLIGPQNSSATFQFAQLCKTTGLATLIGAPTGGNRRGINGGAFFFARLPESGLEFDVPLVGYYPDAEQPDAGIAPDIVVKSTAGSIASRTDVQMDAAISYLLKN